MRRVVVTGMGMVTPLGCGVKHNWARIIKGDSGITNITRWPLGEIPSHVAGVVPRTDFNDQGEGVLDPTTVVPQKDLKKIDTFILYGLAAAKEAIADSGYMAETEDQKCRAGVMVGSGIGGLASIADTSLHLNEKGARRISPFFIPGALINLVSGQISIEHGFKGPNHAVVTACATGAHAIGDAARLIMWGDADVMVAGGAEAAVTPLGVAGFAALRALSTAYNDAPTKASRPFDEGRDGFVIAEGAGVVVLEEYEHAKKRGAKIYGEVVGYGLSGDAYHITSPAEDGDGGFRAMQAALKRAEINPDQIDYINAHGTSTPMGDGIECRAVKRMLGSAVKTVAMSSTKSAIGHLLGAAGAVEAIYSLMAIQNNIAPPTINLENPSVDAEGLNLVPIRAQERPINTVLSNSFGFGGTNASLVFKRV